MRVKTIEYVKTKSYGSFNNVKIGVVVELGEGDSENEAIARARGYVNRKIDGEVTTGWEIENARIRLEQARLDDKERERAEAILRTQADMDLPF